VAIKILIVDDHPMVREGLAAMLSSNKEIDVTGSCGSSEEAIEMAAAQEPDIILMDIKMNGSNGIETTRHILYNNAHIKVIILTVFEDTESIRLSLQAGATGYILKHISREKLIESIKRVYEGETVIDQSIFHHIVNDYTRLTKKYAEIKKDQPVEETPQESRDIELTPREREILHQLVKGLTNKEISAATNLSVDTVKTHLRHIYRKLGVKNRSQAISEAIKISKESSFNIIISPHNSGD